MEAVRELQALNLEIGMITANLRVVIKIPHVNGASPIDYIFPVGEVVGRNGVFFQYGLASYA